mmetsp:Transcript_39352/g.91243  ORF Transcript_39352/g.91243 Transcript_39352/m.91243 type:complete len:280 (-) Transcript_39352:70-909(-)
MSAHGQRSQELILRPVQHATGKLRRTKLVQTLAREAVGLRAHAPARGLQERRAANLRRSGQCRAWARLRGRAAYVQDVPGLASLTQLLDLCCGDMPDVEPRECRAPICHSWTWQTIIFRDKDPVQLLPKGLPPDFHMRDVAADKTGCLRFLVILPKRVPVWWEEVHLPKAALHIVQCTGALSADKEGGVHHVGARAPGQLLAAAADQQLDVQRKQQPRAALEEVGVQARGLQRADALALHERSPLHRHRMLRHALSQVDHAEGRPPALLTLQGLAPGPA